MGIRRSFVLYMKLDFKPDFKKPDLSSFRDRAAGVFKRTGDKKQKESAPAPEGVTTKKTGGGKNDKVRSALLVAAFFAGLFAVSYPSISNWWNARHQSGAIASYNKALADLSREDFEKYWQEAESYNAELARNAFNFGMTPEEEAYYYSVFDPTGTGVMGEVEIPLINVNLPLYHGVADSVLQIAVGHIPGSSLPVGGLSTHSVLSGHRGLPTSRLFTDLDKLAEGDIFILNIMDRTMAYEVDQIRIVLPNEIDELGIELGQDRCTLVTCTPYAINSHRLLVRGRRVDYEREKHLVVPADGMPVDPINAAPIMSIAILTVLFIYQMFFSSTLKKRRARANRDSLAAKRNKEAVLNEMLHRK